MRQAVQEDIVPAPTSFIALRTIPYLHVQLLHLHLQLHQLSNYISCVSNELKGKKNQVLIALCCNKNVICIHRKKDFCLLGDEIRLPWGILLFLHEA